MNKNHWAVIPVSQSVLKKVYIAFVLLCMVISGHAQSQYNNVLVLQGRIKDFVTWKSHTNLTHPGKVF